MKKIVRDGEKFLGPLVNLRRKINSLVSGGKKGKGKKTKKERERERKDWNWNY